MRRLSQDCRPSAGMAATGQAGHRGQEGGRLSAAWGGTKRRKPSAAQPFGATSWAVDQFDALAPELVADPVGRGEVADGLGGFAPLD